jgi:hypothetical protein
MNLQEDEVALAENQLGQLIDFTGLDPNIKNPNAMGSDGFAPDAGQAGEKGEDCTRKPKRRERFK